MRAQPARITVVIGGGPAPARIPTAPTVVVNVGDEAVDDPALAIDSDDEVDEHFERVYLRIVSDMHVGYATEVRMPMRRDATEGVAELEKMCPWVRWALLPPRRPLSI